MEEEIEGGVRTACKRPGEGVQWLTTGLGAVLFKWKRTAVNAV
uniref:Predicted protein n=1 Tax=Hordeum vulgare subsp. vulgare TaxID=112509 RepID=F2DXX9_HORVV|nr:predicted protein [Hordeum vulgare subsp. vulgare]